jgi:hypothetical protein
VQLSLESHPQPTIMLIIGSFPELLMKVSADDAVKPETDSESNIIVNLRVRRRALDCNILDTRPAARVLFHNSFLQTLPLGLRTAVSGFHAEKPWH